MTDTITGIMRRLKLIEDYLWKKKTYPVQTAGSFPPTAHNILSASHGDTTAAAVVRGDLITGQDVNPTWKRLAKGGNGATLRSDGTDIIWTVNTIRRTFIKNVVDNVVTSVFRITTVNEAGSTDGGGFSIFVHALIGNAIINTGSNSAAKSFTAQFCAAQNAGGLKVISPVSEVVETASAATSSANRDIGTVTMSVLTTSNYLTDVQFLVDGTGSSSQAYLYVICEVELIWYGFLTPPVMSQL
jgi:hypothetical protein